MDLDSAIPESSSPDLVSVLFVWLAAAFFLALSPSRVDFSAFRRKVVLCTYGCVYLLLANDSHIQLPGDPGRSRASPSKTKRVIFVRHGESVWNECFNRGFGPSFLVRVLRALLRETALALSLDSIFFDSPLSEEGFAQTRRLQEFVEGPAGEDLRRMCENAVFVTSTLRRAACTALLGLHAALRAGRPVWVLSCLQEISRNVDALALATPHRCPPLRELTGAAGKFAPPSALQAAYNLGNKGLASNGGSRLDDFCAWAFSECSPAALQPVIVVAGHSLWFRTFFQAYLPHTTYHECKQQKMVNCGIVSFELEQLADADGNVEYRIAPDSVMSLYGGFEEKKSKKRKGRSKKE